MECACALGSFCCYAVHLHVPTMQVWLFLLQKCQNSQTRVTVTSNKFSMVNQCINRGVTFTETWLHA